MRNSFLGRLLLVLFFVWTTPVPVFSQSVNINIRMGTSINNNRPITCAQGQRILRQRGFRDVRRIDCRGRFFIYRAWRGNQRFEVALRARDGRVVDLRRIRR